MKNQSGYFFNTGAVSWADLVLMVEVFRLKNALKVGRQAYRMCSLS